MNRITAFWKKGKKALVPFITAGFPRKNFTPDAVLAFANAGADMVEIGIPFSDPVADGPVIQASSQIALQNGLRLKDIFRQAEKIRTKTEIPLLLMGYYNPLLAYGLERFALDAACSGVDGLLIPDLTPEEGGELSRACRKAGLSLVYLIAPTTPPGRMAKIGAACFDFCYCVTLTGVTGAWFDFAHHPERAEGQKKTGAELKDFLLSVRRHAGCPFVAGFGVSTPEQAGWLAHYANGVVVGSALVRIFLDGKNGPAALKKASALVAKMAGRVNGTG